jgi:TRAP-type uncharacterized transport system substrate-binding protein
MENLMHHWRVLLQAAVNEPNTTTVEQLVYQIEEAIYQRFQELARGPSNAAEIQALKAAADNLLAIKVHKLGWPDPSEVTRPGDF